jgi:NAD-dependent DNA ligase
MSIVKHSDGKVDYVLETRRMEAASSIGRASNRQKKLLRFFAIPFSENISAGAAGWEIGNIMSKEECRERWKRYLYLTSDFDSDTDSLKPFDMATLQAVQIPEGWSSSDAFQQFRNELVDHLLEDESPFDRPQPDVSFVKRTFMFTGKFTFGTRKDCQNAVLSRGGSAPDHKSVSRLIDFLVIGTEGSNAWRRGTYGNKIEAAILARREYGSPAIISEQHWTTALEFTKNPRL